MAGYSRAWGFTWDIRQEVKLGHIMEILSILSLLSIKVFFAQKNDMN